eukprot:SAG31_NODE_13094_length_892_cov_52.508197_1_plen_199_part_10
MPHVDSNVKKDVAHFVCHIHKHKLITCSIANCTHPSQHLVDRRILECIARQYPTEFGHFRQLLRGEHDKMNEELQNDFLTNERWLAAIYLNAVKWGSVPLQKAAMVMYTFGQLAMAFDCQGLSHWVRKVSCDRAQRLILYLFGQDINRIGPMSTGRSSEPAQHRTYGLQRGHVGSPNYNVGFPRELLEAILGNIAAVEW